MDHHRPSTASSTAQVVFSGRPTVEQRGEAQVQEVQHQQARIKACQAPQGWRQARAGGGNDLRGQEGLEDLGAPLAVLGGFLGKGCLVQI